MKKLIITLIAALALGSSFVSASSLNSNVSSSAVLGSSDQAMLFDGQVNAVMLDNEEMKNTQGFGFWSSIGSWFDKNKDWLIPVGVVGSAVGCAAFPAACTLTVAF